MYATPAPWRHTASNPLVVPRAPALMHLRTPGRLPKGRSTVGAVSPLGQDSKLAPSAAPPQPNREQQDDLVEVQPLLTQDRYSDDANVEGVQGAWKRLKLWSAGCLNPMLLAKAYYGTTSAAGVFLFPYINLYMRSLGMSNSEIGVLSALRPWLGMLATMGGPMLADRLGIHRAMLITGFLLSTVLRGCMWLTNDMILVAILLLASDLVAAPVGPMADSVVLLGCKNEAAYGRQRVWGSIGWGAVAPLAGHLVQGQGLGMAFLGFLILSVPAALVVANLSYPSPTPADPAQLASPSVKEGSPTQPPSRRSTHLSPAVDHASGPWEGEATSQGMGEGAGQGAVETDEGAGEGAVGQGASLAHPLGGGALRRRRTTAASEAGAIPAPGAVDTVGMLPPGSISQGETEVGIGAAIGSRQVSQAGSTGLRNKHSTAEPAGTEDVLLVNGSLQPEALKPQGVDGIAVIGLGDKSSARGSLAGANTVSDGGGERFEMGSQAACKAPANGASVTNPADMASALTQHTPDDAMRAPPSAAPAAGDLEAFLLQPEPVSQITTPVRRTARLATSSQGSPSPRTHPSPYSPPQGSTMSASPVRQLSQQQPYGYDEALTRGGTGVALSSPEAQPVKPDGVFSPSATSQHSAQLETAHLLSPSSGHAEPSVTVVGDERLKSPKPAGSGGEPSFTAGLRVLMMHPDVWQLLFASLAIGFGQGLIGTYLFLYAQDLSATATQMGLFLTFDCLAETPVFFNQGLIMNHISPNTMLHLALFAMVVRLLLYAGVPMVPGHSPWLILPIELLQGLTLAAGWSAACVLSKRLAPPGLQASLQGLMTAVFTGLGGGLGGLVGGVLLEQKLGWSYTWAGCAVMVAIMWGAMVAAPALTALTGKKQASHKRA